MEKKLIIKKEEIQDFDYSTVDEETGNMMKQAVETMATVTQNTKKVLGEQLSKVQKKLAGNNQYDGFFGKWYSALGLKKDVVYDCIHYYEVLVANSDNQKLQELSFSKVCQLHTLQNEKELQKDVINKVPLKNMKVKQVEELVKEVNIRKEVTDEIIEEIMQKDDKPNSSLKNFVKVANAFIETLENQNSEMKQEEVENVVKLIGKINELCPKIEIEK